MIKALNTRQLAALTRTSYSAVPKYYSLNFVRRYASDIEDLKHETDSIESDVSASTTGVLDVKKSSEVLLYFDHIYPLAYSRLGFKKLTKLLFSSAQSRYNDQQLKEKVIRISNTDKNPLPETAEIVEFVPLKRDGGAFVKISLPPDTTSKELIAQIRSNLKENEDNYNKNIFRYVSNLVWNHFPTCYAVKGTPWIEDLKRFPSSRLKVIFEGNPLTEEELYVLFRRYGQIVDIIPYSSSNNYATIIFNNVRSSICSKNCITGISLNKGKTVLHLQYIPVKRVNYVKDFVVNHQRIAIPVLLALLATIAVLIFDPIREWSMESKITRRYSLNTYKDNKYVKIIYSPYLKLANWVSNSFDFIDEQLIGKYDCSPKKGSKSLDSTSATEELNILWSERYEKAKQLKLWIYENINTFIIVKGPKGSGEKEFVLDHTLLKDEKLSRKLLYIDCDLLVKSRSDNALIKNTASQLGYFPVFTWISSISQFIDLGVQGLTGQKSGLNESKETQLKNMFSLATQALRKVALSDYQVYKSNLIKQKKRKNMELNKDEQSIIPVGDEIMKEDDFLQQHPESKPIIIINKFSGKSDNNNDFVYKIISDWSSQLIQSNLAHVIYITHDVGSIQYLTDSLPNQLFKTISLSDASQKNAKQYVLNQLNDHLTVSDSIDTCLDPLGGRMLDLQAFIRRIKSGESPNDALYEMINQAAEQITTFFLNYSKAKDGDNNWNTAQIWVIMKLLSNQESVDYNELIKSPLFKSSSETLSTLSTLEKHDLISLSRDKGILSKISTGRPLFKAAFKTLINDLKTFKIYEIDYLNNLIMIENNKIIKFEEELNRIGTLRNIESRSNYIVEKIESSNKKIMDYEKKINEINGLGHEKSFLGIKY